MPRLISQLGIDPANTYLLRVRRDGGNWWVLAHGDFPDANAIVDGMAAAGYRIEEPAPYDGPGADQHGSPDQFIAALQWFPGRSRQ